MCKQVYNVFLMQDASSLMMLLKALYTHLYISS